MLGTNDSPTGPAWDQVERTEDGPDNDPELANAVTGLVDWLVDRYRYRIQDLRILEDLYGGKWVTGDDLMPGLTAYAEAGGDPVKLNFARNAVDFVHTKLVGEVPAVTVSARGGGFAEETRAGLVDRYVERLSEAVFLEDVAAEAALHALRSGTAVIKTHGVHGRPGLELVPAEWVFVDEQESRLGEALAVYERRPMPRRAVLERWVPADELDADEPGDAETAIRNAPAAVDPLSFGGRLVNDAPADMIDVYEATSLPDGPDSPGRHVVCVQGHALLDEDYACERLPYAFLHCDPAPVGRGFWGLSLLGQLDDAQAEIDFLLAQVSEQIRLSRLKVFIRSDDAVIKDDHLRSSKDGVLVRYSSATPPTFATPPTVAREALEHIQWLVKEIYEVAGMSEQAATSQKPGGINSGRGILFFHDFQTRRFIDLVRRFGKFVVAVVERLLDRAEELRTTDSEEDRDSDAPPSDIDGLDWAKVRMDRREMLLALEEVSPIPRTYSGRMQRIDQLISQGMVPQEFWAKYIADPTAWLAEARAASQADYLDWLIGLLEDPTRGPVPAVNDKMDFATALEVLGNEALTLERKGAEREIRDRIDDMYDAIVQRQREVQMKAAQAQQAQAGGPQPGSPGPQGSPVPQGQAMPTGGLNPTPQ